MSELVGFQRTAPAICVATLMRPTGDTGVQTHFNGVLRFLAQHQIPSMCITPFSSPRALVHPMFGLRRLIEPVSASSSVSWYRYWHGRFLHHALARELHRRKEPVVVYAQCPVSANAALQARRSRDQHVVMVVHFNVSQADEWADKGHMQVDSALYRRIRRFEELTLPRLDGIVYVSEFMRRELESRLPSLRNVHSSVIPNFVDLPPFPGDVTGDPGGLVSVGTLEPRKNQRYLVEILRAAAELGHRYTLTLIGDGPDRQELKRLAQHVGVRDQLRFLGFQPNVPGLLRGHRLFCHAARQENFPLALLEAMAEGIPVAAAPSGGIPEMFRDGVEGVFWPLDVPEVAAQLLIRCMEDDAALSRMGDAARRRVAQCFTADIVGHQLLEFLTDA